MSDVLMIQKTTLDGIGDAVRELTGQAELIPVPEIENIIKAFAESGIIATGTFERANENSSPEIHHGLGRQPIFALCRIRGQENMTIDDLKGKACFIFASTMAQRGEVFGMSVCGSYNINTGAGNFYQIAGLGTTTLNNGPTYMDEEIVIFKSPAAGNDKIMDGALYDWWVC